MSKKSWNDINCNHYVDWFMDAVVEALGEGYPKAKTMNKLHKVDKILTKIRGMYNMSNIPNRTKYLAKHIRESKLYVQPKNIIGGELL